MAIKGNKNEEGVLLNVGVDTGDSEAKIQELQKKLDALQEVKLKSVVML
ncbi:hypothetical protein [Sphingobacterium sp. IITKGP-BTPF85]|nr:hypothetical protein [Sphingobacterium sp. IITKGP-BTPF85]KKX48337.1 hypothetical protein L950_0221535 [Sphingobacterium sp. IITKGP-BTPF85]